MAMRVSRLLREANIGLQTFKYLLQAMDMEDTDLDLSSKVSDDVAHIILSICHEDLDFLKLLENNAQKNTPSPLKILGTLDIDEYNKPRGLNREKVPSSVTVREVLDKYTAQGSPQYDNDNKEFWIEELLLLSTQGKAYRLPIGVFEKAAMSPLYSVLIGSNGVGKSTMLRDIVDFFIDLHTYVHGPSPKVLTPNKSRLKGVKYHIDGVCFEIIRLGKTFLAKIGDKLLLQKDLRLPSIVACNFGAFDKFPIQKVASLSQTRYNVPYYKYVGAHVNDNMISSSAIAFRLLFALNEHMDDRQRQNISDVLDFIGYDHRISLAYTIVQKSKKAGEARDYIYNKVQNDREYSKLPKSQQNSIADNFYVFYKKKDFSQKIMYSYEIDIDGKSIDATDELKYIYKLKQYDLISSTSVIFYKQGQEITSEEMSSGEFAVLSMILSISAAINDSHTLILIDEPELSLHPNWQMSFIDYLDKALKSKVSHLLIATHSHLLVSDLPMNRSSVSQWQKDSDGNIKADKIIESTYGWSSEEVLLKVFRTATDRNRYFGERIAKLLEQMGNNTISQDDVSEELTDLKEISLHLSDVDPMKKVLNTIIDAYR